MKVGDRVCSRRDFASVGVRAGATGTVTRDNFPFFKVNFDGAGEIEFYHVYLAPAASSPVAGSPAPVALALAASSPAPVALKAGFLGFCDACGGLRNHRLMCPKEKTWNT